MEELVSYIVKKLVNKPDEIEITTRQEKNLTIISIKANKEDLGKIIGKEGKIINSIRTIVKSLSKQDEKYLVKVGA